MVVNDMKADRQAGEPFWPQPSVKTEPNWQGEVKLETEKVACIRISGERHRDISGAQIA